MVPLQDKGLEFHIENLYQWYRSKHHVSRLQSSGKDGDAGIAVFVQDWQCSSRTSHRLVQSQSDVGAGMAECGGLLWFTLQDIGGATGQLLEQNAQAFNQISANFAAVKIHENINLFCQTRNNILTMLNEIEAKKAALPKQMPPFPVKLNEELADSILRQTSMLMPMPNQS
ncbi:DIV and RAD interacting factor 1 [Olea europaea subsp. europaea]|uniref:DIV and RAD interacting factor 1 n=1 Tax=Olea europaea subsp. europaea TaxID=158383 RepID=A0A8S0PL69_OLEEU|nr:DIV and RAD interacting factor 1 [Olea europaea subsp. europaea]